MISLEQFQSPWQRNTSCVEAMMGERRKVHHGSRRDFNEHARAIIVLIIKTNYFAGNQFTRFCTRTEVLIRTQCELTEAIKHKYTSLLTVNSIWGVVPTP